MQALRQESGSSLLVDTTCFQIDYLDLKPKMKLGDGSSRDTYEGEWCGQTDVGNQDLKNDVKQLVGLQHPKVVSFFEWAYKDDAPKSIKSLDIQNEVKCTGGYIVAEKMECDLEDLIIRTGQKATTQRDSGGPFSYSVAMDILLQIVEPCFTCINIRSFIVI